MSTPIPIISVGARESMGLNAIESLKPEFEVIHFTLRASASAEIPLLLRNQIPPSPSSSIGTGNWSSPPRAIIFGGAFTAEDVKELKALVYNGEGTEASKIPWVAVDPVKPRPQLEGNEKGYMDVIAGRFKEGLKGLEAEGKLGEEGLEEVEVRYV